TRHAFSSPGGLALLAIWLSGAGAIALAQRPQAIAEPVTVVLFAQAAVDDVLVTLEQIAKLSGGPESVRQRLAKLDIAEFKLGAAHMTVLSDQVRFRLLLAGLEASAFRLQGARRTNVVESG